MPNEHPPKPQWTADGRILTRTDRGNDTGPVITYETLAWIEGQTKWRPLGSIIGTPVPPPLPPASLKPTSKGIHPLAAYFVPVGRIGRGLWFLFNFVNLFAVGILAAPFANSQSDGANVWMVILGCLWIYLTMVNTGKRLHDLNLSAWLSFVVFIPFVPLFLLILSGTKGPNDYGPAPEGSNPTDNTTKTTSMPPVITQRAYLMGVSHGHSAVSSQSKTKATFWAGSVAPKVPSSFRRILLSISGTKWADRLSWVFTLLLIIIVFTTLLQVSRASKPNPTDPAAQYNLGLSYYYGKGVPKSYTKAVRWFHKAAEQGNADAQYCLGAAYVVGQGVPQDYAQAIKWFRKAAAQGNSKAQYCLAFSYGSGRGVQQDYAEAVKWDREAANQGNVDAQYYLGVMYDNGEGVAQDPAEGAKWIRKAADQGFVKAQLEIGGDYEARQDYKAAAQWYRKAAELGDPDAECRLAAMYDTGTGEPQNFDEASKWYEKAAEQRYVTTQFLATREKAKNGDPLGEWKLGRIYVYTKDRKEAGRGIPMDYKLAITWLRKAAEQGLPQAQLDLAMQQGFWGERKEGIEWLQRAARNGAAGAQCELGMAYLGYTVFWNNVVPINAVEAVKWLRMAAEQGDAQAQGNLGDCYFRGQGTIQDYVQAYKWVDLAAAQGYTGEDLPLSTLERYMTPEQIAAGQQLAREFKPRKSLEPGKLVSGNGIVDSQPSEIGTGFFITQDGYLVTAGHVIGDATQVRVVTSAGTIVAKVVQLDTADDVALLKADGKFAPLPIETSRTLGLGDTVATIGFPDPGLQGFSPKLAKGIIAGLAGAGDDARYFQISVPVQPGNSGGALVDEQGNVVGIVSAKLDAATALAASGALPENVNYAIKSSFLLSFLESVPGVEAKLKKPNMVDEKFEDVVKQAQAATVLVLVY